MDGMIQFLDEMGTIVFPEAGDLKKI